MLNEEFNLLKIRFHSTLSFDLKYCSCSFYNRFFEGLYSTSRYGIIIFGSVSIFSRELLSGDRLATLCFESTIRFFVTDILEQSLIESSYFEEKFVYECIWAFYFYLISRKVFKILSKVITVIRFSRTFRSD